ncbi:unnamed protein product [Peronospora destructor]|uniref:Uncharacterized protein n=1 Tax=Peronospora destructor TaxID=86335 RepID=A0AAV0V3S7_9STRA|nr:unnamed protein product [Peronospora destructor]
MGDAIANLCFPMDPLSQRMGLVILVDETLNIGHQLGVRLPAVMRRRIAAPANEVAPAVVEERKLALARLPELESEVAQHDRVLHEFGDELDHERGVRRSLEKIALSQLENERRRQALRDELSSARREIVILERNGCIRPRKKPRADSTGGADQRKT